MVHARKVTHRAAVIGMPAAHSLSPVLHRAAYADLGLTDWEYTIREVAPAELAGLLEELRAPAGEGEPVWAGLSVTMPHKQELVRLADVVDPLADVVGAANTVVAQRSGRGRALLAVFNTDVAGIVGAVREQRPGSCQPPRRAVILGSGATACSALAAVTELGASEIAVAARRHAGPGRAAAAAHRMGLEITQLPWQPGAPGSDRQVAQALAEADLVVSTLPAGAAGTLAASLAGLVPDPGALEGRVLLDVVYSPWPTALAAAWQGSGGAIAPGWLMLLHQAVDQVRLMTGRMPVVEPMRAALQEAIRRREAGDGVR